MISPTLEGMRTNRTILTPMDTISLSSPTLFLAAREERVGKIAVDKAIAKRPRGN